MAPPAINRSDRPTRRDESTMNRGELMTRLLGETSDRNDNHLDSSTVKRMASNPIVERPVNRSKECDITQIAPDQLTSMLDARDAQVKKESLIGITENIVDDHSMSFIRGTMKRVIFDMLMSIMLIMESEKPSMVQLFKSSGNQRFDSLAHRQGPPPS